MGNLQQDYWRPVVEQGAAKTTAPSPSQEVACARCGTEFIIGAHFCHVCGEDRHTIKAAHRWIETLDFDNVRRHIGLSAASTVAFLLGMAAVFAAMGVGFIYTTTTLVDWQAVQTWRIEWMLAAIVSFVAGILLKRPV